MDIDKNVYRVFNKEDLKDHEAIAAVIRNSDGKYLLLQHKKYNFWTIPIGKVKVGQSIEAALKEEISEECDIDVIKFKEVWCFSEKYERKDYLVTIKTHIFEVLIYNGKGNNMEPEKHSELKWMSLDEIKSLKSISDSTKEYLSVLEEKKKRKILNMVYVAHRGNVYYEDLFCNINKNFKVISKEEIREKVEFENMHQDDSDVIVLGYFYDTDTIEMHHMSGRFQRDSVAHRDGRYRASHKSGDPGYFYDSGELNWRKNYKKINKVV